MIRVGGRLQRADLPFEQKCPILLPKDARITRLLIDQVHRSNGHPGALTVQNIIRQHFWVLSARGVIRKQLHIVYCVSEYYLELPTYHGRSTATTTWPNQTIRKSWCWFCGTIRRKGCSVTPTTGHKGVHMYIRMYGDYSRTHRVCLGLVDAHIYCSPRTLYRTTRTLHGHIHWLWD